MRPSLDLVRLQYVGDPEHMTCVVCCIDMFVVNRICSKKQPFNRYSKASFPAAVTQLVAAQSDMRQQPRLSKRTIREAVAKHEISESAFKSTIDALSQQLELTMGEYLQAT